MKRTPYTGIVSEFIEDILNETKVGRDFAEASLSIQNAIRKKWGRAQPRWNTYQTSTARTKTLAIDVLEWIMIGIVVIVVIVGLLAYYLGKARGQVKGMKEASPPQTMPQTTA